MQVELLGQGSIELVESWGSDERVIEAARMSTQGGFRGWGTPDEPGDEKLLGYLWRNAHHTPFEMAGATFEIQAPIIVFREWHRHRTQSYNEASARYSPLPALDYVPTVERLMVRGGQSKQAQSTGAELSLEGAQGFVDRLVALQSEAQSLYEDALHDGVPKELARLALTVGRFSKMRASANLRNWLGFLRLRMDVAAQWEIRQYANAAHSLLSGEFPRTLQLFNEGL